MKKYNYVIGQMVEVRMPEWIEEAFPPQWRFQGLRSKIIAYCNWDWTTAEGDSYYILEKGRHLNHIVNSGFPSKFRDYFAFAEEHLIPIGMPPPNTKGVDIKATEVLHDWVKQQLKRYEKV